MRNINIFRNLLNYSLMALTSIQLSCTSANKSYKYEDEPTPKRTKLESVIYLSLGSLKLSAINNYEINFIGDKEVELILNIADIGYSFTFEEETMYELYYFEDSRITRRRVEYFQNEGKKILWRKNHVTNQEYSSPRPLKQEIFGQKPSKNKEVFLSSQENKLKFDMKEKKSNNKGDLSFRIKIDENGYKISSVIVNNTVYRRQVTPDNENLYDILDVSIDNYVVHQDTSLHLRENQILYIADRAGGGKKNPVEHFGIYIAKIEDFNQKFAKIANDKKKAEEDSKLTALIDSKITNKLGRINFTVVDNITGLNIQGVDISITSDAKEPRIILQDNNFPIEQISRFNIPYYPNSWDGDNWGNGNYCKYYQEKSCSFTIYKDAKHKVIAKHLGYREFKEKIEPDETNSNYEIRMDKEGVIVDIPGSISSGGGKLIKK